VYRLLVRGLLVLLPAIAVGSFLSTDAVSRGKSPSEASLAFTIGFIFVLLAAFYLFSIIAPDRQCPAETLELEE